MRCRHHPSLWRPGAPAGRAALLLLWLLVALMPLRAVSPWAMDRPAVAAATVQAGLALPCHGEAAMADTAHAGHPTGMDGAADASQVLSVPGEGADTPACHACDLCHAAMAGPVIAAAPALPTAAAAVVAPAAGPLVAAPGDGIFRPPRG